MSPDNNTPVKGFRSLGEKSNDNDKKEKKDSFAFKPVSVSKKSSVKEKPESQEPSDSPSSQKMTAEANVEHVPSARTSFSQASQSEQQFKPSEPQPWETPVNKSRTTAPPPRQQETLQGQTMQSPPKQPDPPQQSSRPYGYVAPLKNPGTAFALELVGGIFGFFGIGYMYAGKTSEGVMRLIAGIVCNLFLGFILIPLTLGVCGFIAIPFYIGIAIMSANSIKNYLLQQQAP